MDGIQSLVGQATVLSVHMMGSCHTVFFARLGGTVTGHGGFPWLVPVGRVQHRAAVFDTVLGLTAVLVTVGCCRQVRFDTSKVHGSWPEMSAFCKRFFTVWTILTIMPLLCGYLGELVTCLIPYRSQKEANS